MLHKLRKSEIFKGSLILIVMFNLFNFFNYIFQFSMVRLLTVEDYGVLATLFAILYILSIFSESIQIMVTKYSSEEKNNGKVKNILKRAFAKGKIISMKIFIFYLVISIFLSYWLEISYWLMALNGIVIFTSFLIPINRGVMQGKKKFSALGINMVIESLGKLVLAVTLVILGWRVYGAITGVIIGSLLAFLFSFFNIKDVLKEKEISAESQQIKLQAKPTFIVTFVILVFYSLDIVIAKAILPTAELVGTYAIAAILAKTIFFGTQPVSRAMFPLTAENTEKKNGKVFKQAIGIVMFLIIVALILFYLFPEFIIWIFSGRYIKGAVEILFYLGIAIGLLSLSNLILLYKLSRGKRKGYFYLPIFLVLEAILLFTFSETLIMFSLALIASSGMLLIASLLLLNER
ncbi:MAG: oligosaccharide flippase family protein [archaeon]